jgi:signal transduction histidine kinase
MYTTQAPLYFILLIVFIVIGIKVFYFIIAVIGQQRYVKRLRKSKDETEITTLENERKRLAADIHDELGPLLSAAKLKYSEVEVFSTDDTKLLNQGHLLVDEIVSKMRHIAKDLMPTVLFYKGLVFAIREFINHIAAHNNLKIDFSPGQMDELTEFQALHVYRILQEIIHNTLKHADAAHLKIVMYTIDKKLIISTVDDGRGFNYKTMVRQGGGLGLYNVQSRTDILNGELQVKSKIGTGTNFCITIPL